jgi:hypothetical protein
MTAKNELEGIQNWLWPIFQYSLGLRKTMTILLWIADLDVEIQTQGNVNTNRSANHSTANLAGNCRFL